MTFVWTLSGHGDKRGSNKCKKTLISDEHDRYDTARKLRHKQDAFCERVKNSEWSNIGKFPQDLQWQPLVDILRGKVKVNGVVTSFSVRHFETVQVQTHCYEAVDFDNFVRVGGILRHTYSSYDSTYLPFSSLMNSSSRSPLSTMHMKHTLYRAFSSGLMVRSTAPISLFIY
jgi:hypothetical protein